jgi:hypothetical protein
VSRAITPVGQGAQIASQLHSGRVYLIKAGLTNNTAARPGQGQYIITISGGGLYTPGEAITVTNSAISGSPRTFPNIAFYVDYIRRAEEAGGVSSFLTMGEYMNCLNRENWVFTFDLYGDELEDINGGVSLDADGKSQSGWAPQSIDLASPSTGVGSTSAAVDATVNWGMFNKKNGYSIRDNFLANVGSSTGLISYYDYVDWLLNYANNTNSSLFSVEDRQTWFTFEAFCVWKRMEPWDMYVRSDLSAGSANILNLIKTKIPLDITVLSGVDKRGGYSYYHIYNTFSAWLWQINSNSNGIRIADMQRGVSTVDGVPWVYNQIMHAAVLDNFVKYENRYVPRDSAGDYLTLHIEYESAADDDDADAADDGPAFYYDSVALNKEQTPGDIDQKELIITLVNIKFQAFKTAAKTIYESTFATMRDKDGKTVSTVPYDKYMYYWATHSTAIGLVPFPSGEYNGANTPEGSAKYWEEWYGMQEVSSSFGNITRPYEPLYQRMEETEERRIVMPLQFHSAP